MSGAESPHGPPREDICAVQNLYQTRRRMKFRWNFVVIFVVWLCSVDAAESTTSKVVKRGAPTTRYQYDIPDITTLQSFSVDPNKRAIPANILLTHKRNLLEFSNEELDDVERVLRATMQHTVNSLPGYKVMFFNNTECGRALGDIHPKLEFFFHNESIGMLKADMCRLALLWSHGGLYFDTDILPVVDLHKYVHRNTTFTTVRSTGEIKDNEGFFQAFLGAVPHHPVIGNALQRTLWYYMAKHSDDTEQMEELMLGYSHGNIGTILLLGAFCSYTGEAKNTTAGPLSPNMSQGQTMNHADGHVSQIFLEASLANVDPSWDNHAYVLGSDPEGSLTQPPHCEYVVVDRKTKSVVFYSRTYAGGEDTFCMVAWVVLPQAFPRINGTDIPRMLHIVGNTSTVGDYNKWKTMNSHWAVKLWTQPETRYFIRQLFPAHIQNAPYLENLSQDEVDSLFSFAVMYKYGGVLALPRDAESYITLSYWPNQTNVSSYCMFDEHGVVAAVAKPNHQGLQKIMKMITGLAELTLGRNAAQFTVPSMHHAMTESTIASAAEMLHSSLCLASPRAFHIPIPDLEPVLDMKFIGVCFLFGTWFFVFWKRCSMEAFPVWVASPLRAIIHRLGQMRRKLDGCMEASPIKETPMAMHRVGSRVGAIIRDARKRTFGKVMEPHKKDTI